MKTLRLVQAEFPNFKYEVIHMATQMIKLTDKAVSFKAGSARANWYGAVKQYDGKAPEAFVEGATKNPPATTKEGKAEHPAGWLRYFMKEGIVVLVQAEAAPAGEAPAPKPKKSKKQK